MPSAISYVSIGVADMQAVEALWVDLLGLEVVARRQGPDPQLGRLWGLHANDIRDQLLLTTSAARTGRLHFVEFANPGTAIRKDAAPYDLGAKNLDVNCDAMPEKIQQLRAEGYAFRSDMVEYELEGVRAREIQMPAHDGLNVVFIEVLSEGFETPYSGKGFAAVTSFVVIVEDTASEAEFYKAVFGLDEILQHNLAGPDIEKVIGLPKGAALQMRLCGTADNMFGRMELITYEGLAGADRFTTAQAPATGILRCGFVVDSMNSFIAAAAAQHVPVTEPKQTDAIYGTGRIASLESPAGLRIEVLELA